ncbi:hypothetical protein BpHYR1_015957 [Brachionus plicatilis]|uniref:Uncharacterized protein n=1 Tax=Brachionus plicatilis TaxID=10195 RepID=A0A3M7PLE9_BRAPC|nr:hypothetical protein BpHYR1_015957 [Brachionus plicatilis]
MLGHLKKEHAMELGYQHKILNSELFNLNFNPNFILFIFESKFNFFDKLINHRKYFLLTGGRPKLRFFSNFCTKIGKNLIVSNIFYFSLFLDVLRNLRFLRTKNILNN